MAIQTINKRLQYKYYTFRENPDPLPVGEPYRYKTFLPMIYDSVYSIPDSMKYSDAYNRLVIKEKKSPEEAAALLSDSNGYFRPDQGDDIIGFLFGFNNPSPYDSTGSSSRIWNGIISINGRNTGILPRGVTWQYNTDSVIAIISPNDFAFGVIPPETLIEIVLEKANSATPWFYYGPTRYDLATRLGREPTGMGGLHPSVVPADAISMTYRMDNDVTVSLGENFIIPFVSAQAIPVPGFGAALKEVKMMWEFLDGRLNDDGSARTAIRSSTDFFASSLSILTTFQGIGTATAAQTDWVIGSYRNIHSKTLEYKENTYSENKFIENTTFVLMCEQGTNDFNQFYRKLSSSFLTYLNKFIDFGTCRFDVWKFKRGKENNIPVHVGMSSFQDPEDSDNLAYEEVSSLFLSIEESLEWKTPSLKDCFRKIYNQESPNNIPPYSGILQNLFKIDMEAYNTEIRNGADREVLLDPRGMTYSVVFLSDFDFQYVHEVNGVAVPDGVGNEGYYSPDLGESILSLGTFPGEVETGLIDSSISGGIKVSYVNSNLKVSGSSITSSWRTNEYIIEPDSGVNIKWSDFVYDHAEQIFGKDSAFSLIENDGFGCFVTGFLGVLAGSAVDIEDDMLKADSTVVADVLVSQCNSIIEKSSSLQTDGTEIVYTESTLVDRIFSLYTKGFQSGNNSAEIRYWRKMCPIGQLYRLTGKIGGGVNIYNGDYYFSFIIDGDSDNRIWVYLERGAKTNTISAQSGETFTIQGRLYYPDYFMGNKVDNFLDFTTAEGAAQWYRLRDNTLDFIYNEFRRSPINATGSHPILIIRSNYLLSPITLSEHIANNIINTVISPTGIIDPIGNIGVGVSAVFSDLVDNTYQYGARRTGVFDEVEDFFYNVDLEKDPTKNENGIYTPVQLGRGERIVCLDTGYGEVELNNIKMKMEVIDGNGDYLYEIRYKRPKSTQTMLLWRFHSELAKLSVDGEINFKISGLYKMVCEPGPERDNRTFYIKYPYSKKQIEGSDQEFVVSYDFKWQISEFDVVGVWRNDSRIGSGYLTRSYQIYPLEGKIVFFSDISTSSEVIQIEIINVSDLIQEQILSNNYNVTKLGNYLEIRRVDSVAVSALGPPKISEIQLNIGKKESVERVECVFSSAISSSGTTRHYIAPAYGFEYFSGDGSWSMLADEKSRILAGDITSPYFFIDRALELSNSDRYLDKTNETLVSLDRIYGNIASLSQPFVTTMTRFQPPPDVARVVKKSSVIYDKVMQKTTLVYTDNEIMNTKYSFLDFQSKDDVDKKTGEKKRKIEGTDESYIRTNLRYSYPVRSVDSKFMTEEVLFSGISEEVVFETDNRLGHLTGLVVKALPNTIDEHTFSEPFELSFSDQKSGGDESFLPFGYETFSGSKIAKRFGSYTPLDSLEARSYVLLPDTRDVERLKISKPTNSMGESISDAGKITEVIGEYVEEYFAGICPQLSLSSSGDYFLFYINEDNGQIMLLSSKDDGHKWNRPAVAENSLLDGDPIPIYENIGGSNSAFGSLLGLKNFDPSISILTFYDYSEHAVEMLVIPESLVKRIENGIGELENEVINPDDVEKIVPTSWGEYFNNRKNIRRVLNTEIDIFSIVSSPTGALYFAFIESNGGVRIMRNMNFRDFSPQGSDWVDCRVNLIHEDSKLYKALDGRLIKSITMLYGKNSDGFLYIFLSTNDEQLILIIISHAVFDTLETTEQEKVDEKQNFINETTPYLIIGDVDSFSEIAKENISINNSFLEEKRKFGEQIISGVWSRRGELTLFYYDEDSNLRALKTNSPLGDWEENENV